MSRLHWWILALSSCNVETILLENGFIVDHAVIAHSSNSLVTILISLPTGTKIFNWLSTYLGLIALSKSTSAFFGLLFLLMFTIGGSTGIILGNAAVDLGLHDTYYVVAHFHFVLSLGTVIAIFSSLIFNVEKIVGSKNLLPSSSCTLSLYHLVSTFIGILLAFFPMHLLGF